MKLSASQIEDASVIARMDAMCAASLSPDESIKWREIKAILAERRHNPLITTIPMPPNTIIHNLTINA